MVKATVTFDVELTSKESRAVDLLQQGFSTGQAAVRMKISLDEVEDILRGIRLDKPLNLVDATRDRRVSWVFDYVAMRKTA
jgi:hypothetical protein